MQVQSQLRQRLPPAVVSMMDKGFSPSVIQQAVKRERADRSLHEFIRQGWPIVEPKRPFVDNWHIGAIASHLEAVSSGDLNRLLILVPPGTMKSLSASVFWPAWDWGPNNNPYRRFMFSSYAAHLSNRDSLRCKRIIKSPWYQSLWGARYTLKLEDGKDTEKLYHTSKTGFRLATSTHGVATGERADVVIADDPHNVLEAESDKERTKVLEWWNEAMPTRVNDPDHASFVVIMQRLHSNDLAGDIMRQGGYEVLTLPMEFEEERRCFTSLRPKSHRGPDRKKYSWDPRIEEGELLFPKRISAKTVARLKNALGSYASAGQLQQRPSPRGGGMVKLAWFGRYRAPPGQNLILRIIQSWDTAEKGGVENAYSVCGTWAQCETGHFLLHVLRRRMNNATLRRTAAIHAKKWKADAVVIEDKSSGTALIEHLRDPAEHKQETTFNVFGVLPDKDKVTRMDIETPTIEAGNVFIPEDADWLPDYEAELEAFPNSAQKDQADMTSQYLKWVRKHTIEQDWGMV